ncbi:MAG: 30S ribosomal protein S18 [Bacteroidetes bacterium]|nr:30S ribosomal protein S18 [Bacteroidota bacterium]
MAVNNYKNIFINITPQERTQNNKFCWFKKHNIKYIDFKDPIFMLRFVNDQGKMYPRRITGTSLKYQRRLATAIKRARHLAILPYVADSLK